MTPRRRDGRSPVAAFQFLPLVLGFGLLVLGFGLAACSGDDEPPTGNVHVTLRNASLGIPVDTGDIDTLVVTVLDATGEPLDSTRVMAAPPLSGGTRSFDLDLPVAAGLVIRVKATGERPVAGAPPATYVRGVLRRGESEPFDIGVGDPVSVEVRLTPFVTAFHDVQFLEDRFPPGERERHRVSWRPLPGAVRWRVSIDEGGIRDTVLADTTLVGTRLQNTYQVHAIDADSMEGAAGDLLEPQLLLPGPPANLRLTPSSGERILVRWNPGTGFVHTWELERRAEAGSFLPFVKLGADTLQFVDSTVVDGRRWEYRARARNSYGPSEWSAPVAAVAPLNPPEDVTITLNDLEIGLGWTERSLSEEGVVVERASGNGAFVPLITLPVNASGYIDAPLAERTRYRYRVQTVRGVIASAYTPVVEATTPLHVPSSPAGLTASAISPMQIDLAWGAARGLVENYQVERRRPNETFVLHKTLAGDAQVYADLGLPAGTTYEYRVRAVNETGPGSYSNVATATTHAAPR